MASVVSGIERGPECWEGDSGKAGDLLAAIECPATTGIPCAGRAFTPLRKNKETAATEIAGKAKMIQRLFIMRSLRTLS
jgi:hypothetical protein